MSLPREVDAPPLPALPMPPDPEAFAYLWKATVRQFPAPKDWLD